MSYNRQWFMKLKFDLFDQVEQLRVLFFFLGFLFREEGYFEGVGLNLFFYYFYRLIL